MHLLRDAFPQDPLGEEVRNALVLAIGNPDRGDDGIGRRIAGLLDPSALGARVVERGGGAAECLEVWQGEDAVVVIDAVQSGAPPGTVQVFDAHAELPFPSAGVSTHGFGLGEAIGLGKALGQLPRRLFVVGIEGKSFEPGTGLSEEVSRALPRAIETVLETVRRLSHA